MKNYQVTRKLQITIPKRLAKELGIVAGDAVRLEKIGDTVVVKKAEHRDTNATEIRKAVMEFSKDIPKIRKYVKIAEKALVESLSRHVRP